jgi:muramidase (phage lysozyme)
MYLMLNDGITNTASTLVNEVEILQQSLKNWGVLPTSEPNDGQFGEKTEAAVKLFQSKHALTIDGIVGQQTWAELLKVEPFEVTMISRPESSNNGKASITKQQKAFLDMISVHEGTSGPDGYRVMFTGKLFDNGFVDHPRQLQYANGISSDAAGRYQFLSTTWDACKQALGLPDFSPDSQDRAAIYLIRQRGALEYVNAGDVVGACNLVSYEWASLPPGRYGQPAITFEQAEELFQEKGGVLASS